MAGLEGQKQMGEKVDSEFNRIIVVEVLGKISMAFNILAIEASGNSLNYNHVTECLMEKKACKAKQIICDYIDSQVEAYKKYSKN